MALSIDLRERVVKAYISNEGGYEAIAERFNIGICSVRRWVALQKETGRLETRPHKGRQAKIPQQQLPELEALVLEKSDRTTEELKNLWIERKGVSMHASSVLRALKRLGMTVKKRPFGQRNATKSRFKKNEPNF